MESIVSFAFDDFEVMQSNLSSITKYEHEARGHLSMGFVQTWLAIFHYERYHITRKRIHRRFARTSHRKVHLWSKTGTEILYGPNLMLNAMAQLCMLNSSIEELTFSFEEAARGCHTSKCQLIEAIAYQRLAKELYEYDPTEADRYKIYQDQAVAMYWNWGAKALAEHVENLYHKA
jgi:hypothetical protein